MQVLPRFVSVDAQGNQKEFLLDYFKDPMEALSAVFLKGYQWPFDSRKVMEGSSVIDLLVYRETVLRGNRVYLDYSKNPFGMEDILFESLSAESYTYLKKAESCFGTPIQRLQKMNQPASALYRSKGVNIETEYLEIALCAQHNNGGIAVDLWWQTQIPGLFAAGECAGTHGVSRPGGSALNAGQVGSLRAAQYICARGRGLPDKKVIEKLAQEQLQQHLEQKTAWQSSESNTDDRIKAAQKRMSACGGPIRNVESMRTALIAVEDELRTLRDTVKVSAPEELVKAYKLKDLLLTQKAMLTAMIDFAVHIGGTRGSALYTDSNGDLRDGLEELFRFSAAGKGVDQRIQQVCIKGDDCQASWRNVRPMPRDDNFFENVWRQYRENQNVY